MRTRVSPNHLQDLPDDDQYGQQPSSLNSQLQSNQLQQINHHHQQAREQYQQPSRILNRNSSQHDVEDIKDICLKLASELDIVKSRLAEISGSLEQMRLQQQRNQLPSIQNHAAPMAATATTDNNSKKKKAKLLRRRNKSERDQQNSLNGSDPIGGGERLLDRRQKNQRPEMKDKPLPPRPNDDSTTQAADPSSEDRIEGDNDGERVKRVIRRRKQNPNRRGYNRRNRADSSERNSNDTSPQNEADEDDYRRPHKPRSVPKNIYPELSDAELDALVQAMCRDFFASEMEAVDKAIVERSPHVARVFATAILETAICDVTSPTRLSEIATNLSQALVGIEGGRKFERGFYLALTDLAKREDDIAIDAPRYMDTLGQVLGQCLIPLNTGRNRSLMKVLLRQSVFAYGKKSGHKLLASILKALASCKSERYAVQIYEYSNLSFSSKIWNDEFLESQDIKFINKRFSPEPRETRKAPAEMEKFADDVTDLVEKGCTAQKVDDMVKDLELEADEKTDYLGTLVYAVVRGCLVTDSGDYKLDTEALSKYSALLKNQQCKKEQQDAIALHALTALTKLWHSYNCPQNLMSNILLTLHSHGGASYDVLKTWLNSDDLKNIPGIGAARLNSKRCIEDLGAVRS